MIGFRILLGGFVAAAIVFACDFASNRLLSFHDRFARYFTNQDRVLEVMRANAPVSGVYTAPYLPATVRPEDPEFREHQLRLDAGPIVTSFVRIGGESEDQFLNAAISFLVLLVAAMAASMVMAVTSLIATNIFVRIGIMIILAVFGLMVGPIHLGLRMNAPWPWMLADSIEHLVSWTLAGCALSLIFWPPDDPIPPIRTPEQIQRGIERLAAESPE